MRVHLLFPSAAVLAWACAPPSPTTESDPPFHIGATIEVGAAPHGIRFSTDGDTAYVALSGDGQIAVVDLTGPAVVARWDAGETPLDLVRLEDGWLVSQFRDSTLIRLDAAGRPLPDATHTVSPGPSLFAPGTVRGRTWITTEFSDRLWAIDTRTGTPTASHPTGDRPYPGDVMWDGSHAFVPNLDAGTVSVIDLLNGETDASVEVCPGPPGGALTPDQVTYIVACGGSDEVALINTASFRVTGRVSGVGPRPFSVAVPGDGRYAVVNNAGGSTVSVVDIEALAVAQTIEVGAQPIVLRVHPDGERVFVANEIAGTLVELIPGAPDSAPAPTAPRTPTEVVVLGMLHSGHLDSDRFSLDVVRDLVREIDPDYWLTEIPPNRWDRARAEYEATGTVEEPRVQRFPGLARRADRHEQLALGGELEHGVAGRGGAGPPRIGDPHVAVVVDIDPVRPRDHPAAEAAQQVPLLVEEQDRVDVRVDAGVSPATLRDPDVPVQRDLDGAGRSPLPAVGQLAPAVDGSERVAGVVLGGEWGEQGHGRHDADARRANRSDHCLVSGLRGTMPA